MKIFLENVHSQTERAKALKFWENIHNPWFGPSVTIPSLPWLVPHSSLQCCHSCFRDYRAIKVLRITENLQNHSIQERTNYRTTKERHERKKRIKLSFLKGWLIISNWFYIGSAPTLLVQVNWGFWHCPLSSHTQCQIPIQHIAKRVYSVAWRS